MDFLLILAGFILISAIITLLVKKFTKHDTFYLISLIKSKKPLPFFDAMAKHKKFIDWFSTIGLILGFGAVAIDFVYGKNLSKLKRVLLFIFSFSGLSLFLIGFDSLLGGIFSNNILIGSYYPLLVVSFGLMGLAGFTLFSLCLQALDIVSKYLLGIKSCPGVAPLIPGIEIPGVPITPPLHAWLSLLIILLVHEGMHGIVGRRHGFKVKSTGVILLGFLPIGAFVEPDEKELEHADDKKLISFLAAGPMANIALMGIVAVFFMGAVALVEPTTEYFYPGLQDNYFEGVEIDSVLEETGFCGSVYSAPAFGEFEKGDKIKQINGVEINTPSNVFSELQKNKFEEKEFLLERNKKEILVALVPNALGQFGFVPMGIENKNLIIPESYYLYATSVGLFIEFIYWLILLNFLVAAINFLPLHPFDGGRISKIIFAPYIKGKKSKKESQEQVAKIFKIIILGLFLINALPLFF